MYPLTILRAAAECSWNGPAMICLFEILGFSSWPVRCSQRATPATDLLLLLDAEDSLPKNFRACDKCSEEEQKRQALSDAFDAHHSQRPLTMLDPYSGAGGLFSAAPCSFADAAL